MRNRGFTMLELMVVIGIIALLMAALFAALAKIRQRTAIGQARNLVEKCSSALETYRLNFRQYPDPADVPSYTSAQALHYFLSTAFRKDTPLKPGEVPATINMGPLVQFEERDYRVQSSRTEVIDPWGTPLVFRILTIKDSSNLDMTVPQIYSCGVNKADDNGLLDDISPGK
ncbi:MAG: prepilin-type N-terminal cleavage/methylation domain-containing protein [Planctomycetota bacterium]|nr:prepilin-type N-terminal cleavage/methylation domain-containing protein [Planctomycetota bacterium]